MFYQALYVHIIYFSILQLDKEEARRFNTLKQQLATATAGGIGALLQPDLSNLIGTTSTNVSPREQIKNEIENILAADCLYCGEYMIESIDKPFIDDWDKVNLDWQ